MTPKEELPPPTMIETLPELEKLSSRLQGIEMFALDMESDSFYVYHEKICLLQISTREEDIIIDPLAVKDISPLGPLFRDPRVEKVFHAGEYDISCLKRDYGFKIVNIFDTMVAERTLGRDKLGLAPAIERHFGVKISKKLQRADWGKRPLTPAHLEYARLDTHYLLALRDILHRQVEEKGLLKEALEEFARMARVEPEPKIFNPEDFWRLPGARELDSQAKAVLKVLYLYREKKAAALDRAPFRVLPQDLLVRLSRELPRNLDALRQIKGVTPYLLNRYGKELLVEIEKGLRAQPVEKPPERPESTRWDNNTLRRYEALRQWRKEQAERRGVNPVVILATEEMRQLAQAPKQGEASVAWLESLSDYKKDLYGPELLRILIQPLISGKGQGRRRSHRRKAAKT